MRGYLRRFLALVHDTIHYRVAGLCVAWAPTAMRNSETASPGQYESGSRQGLSDDGSSEKSILPIGLNDMSSKTVVRSRRTRLSKGSKSRRPAGQSGSFHFSFRSRFLFFLAQVRTFKRPPIRSRRCAQKKSVAYLHGELDGVVFFGDSAMRRHCFFGDIRSRCWPGKVPDRASCTIQLLKT